jgi:hypothetical protein
MKQFIRTGAITLAIFGSVGFAAAQSASGSGHPELTPAQQRTVSQGLTSSPSQPAPSAQPQVGDKIPDSMSAQNLPSNVTDQVPEAKNLLFVKLPDRVMLIDPDTQLVTEIVFDGMATGSNSNSPDRTTGSNSNSSDRPSK